MSDKYKEKWDEMVAGSREATEDFNDFFDDKVIIYAADRIKELENDIAVMTLRLMCEDNSSHSPDALSVLDKWMPVVAKKHGIRI